MIRQLLILLLIPMWSHAYESVTFITAQDRFTVNKSPQASIDGKPVQNDLLKTLDPFLTGPATDDCPNLPARGPISAKITMGNKVETRDFFVDRGLVRVEDHCFSATGDGLYFLPLHRSWLIGPFKETITLKSPLKVVGSNGAVLATLQKRDGTWFDVRPKTELDWDFFQKFEQSLAEYRVKYRVAPAIAKGRAVVTVQSGREQLKLYRLGEKFWAVQRPSRKWLEASADWSFWFDLDNSIWLDRRTGLIRQAEAAGKTIEQRLSIMKQLDTSGWSRAIQEFYQRRMLDSHEDLQIRLRSLERLRTKPSWQNIAAEIALLQSNPSDELLSEATSALRARNPKGSVYTPNVSVRSKIITEWLDWWDKNKTRKD